MLWIDLNVRCILESPHCTGKTGKMVKRIIPCQGKHRESEKITKTNLDTGYVCQVSCVYVITGIFFGQTGKHREIENEMFKLITGHTHSQILAGSAL